MHQHHRPIHVLDSLDIKLWLPDKVEGHPPHLEVHGRSRTKRGNLWTYAESFPDERSSSQGYGVGDALHHIALVCIQDTPNTMDRLDFALSGGVTWWQGELPI